MSRRKTNTLSMTAPQALLGDIRALIESAHHRTTAMVNSELTLLFWRIGRRIHTEVLAGERAGYGEKIVPALAAQLTSGLWRQFCGEKPAPHGAVRGDFPGRANCRDTVATIELVALRFASAAQRSVAAGILRSDVLRRTLERTHAARTHRFDAV